MKRILFLYYPLKVHYNHGVSLLASILRERGIEVFVVELDILIDVQQIVEENEIDFIGFSIVTSQEYNLCLPFMYDAKQTGKSVLVGGVYVKRGSYIDPSAADYICRGEGEILPDFILNGKTEIFDKPYFHENLDNLPLPDYSKLTGYELDRDYLILKGLKIYPYQSSRGCPYQCSFCEIRFQPSKVRIKSMIHEDMDLLAEKYHPDLFCFMDALLPYYNEEWCKNFDGNKHPFIAYIRADISRDKLMFLIRNGLKMAAFGIESGDEIYRNEYLKKDLMDADIHRTIAVLQAHNIAYVPFYMSGTPFETKEIRAKTMGMARALGGLPQIWVYEDLSKRVFNIDDDKLREYAKTVKGNFDLIKAVLNDPFNYVYSENGDFIIYRFWGDTMVIHDLNASPFILHGKYWQDKIEELCKEGGAIRYLGKMSKEFNGFQKKYGLTHFGNLIGRNIKWQQQQ